MTNQWIAKVLETEAKRGKDKAIERGQGICMSLSLGREFGETMEAYEVRHPEIAEFYRFWETYS
jgi:hypothetical protein